MIAKYTLRNSTFRALARLYSESAGTSQTVQTPAPPTSPAAALVNADVPGLSSAVVHPTSQPVGPGVDPSKTGAYKVPEYFCYDSMSFFEAEIEMAKFRCPQPSAVKK